MAVPAMPDSATGRVEAAIGAHLRLETVGDAEDATKPADILSVDDHGVVLAHRVAQGRVERTRHGELHQPLLGRPQFLSRIAR